VLREVRYFERQSFHPTRLGIAVGCGVLGLILILPFPWEGGDVTPVRGIAGAVLLAGSVVALNLLTMSTWVYPDELRIQFGRLLPYYERRIPMTSIRAARIVSYDDPVSTGGSGIRSGEFEDTPTQFLNAHGPQGVLVEGSGRQVFIGTRHAERLQAEIERALGAVEYRPPADRDSDDSEDTEDW